jgi:hypothetical protein
VKVKTATKVVDKKIKAMWEAGHTDTAEIKEELLDDILQEPEAVKNQLLQDWIGSHIANVLAKLREKGRTRAADARTKRSGKNTKSRRKSHRKAALARLDVPYADAENHLKPLGDFTLEDVEAALNRWAHKWADAEHEMNKWDKVRARMVRNNAEKVSQLKHAEQFVRMLGL